METLTETISVTREITGPVRDLVLFARSVEGLGGLSNDELIRRAKEFYDQQHGED